MATAEPRLLILDEPTSALDVSVQAVILIRLRGEPRSSIDPSPVCRYHGRCPDGVDRCQREMPVLRSREGGLHEVACHPLEGDPLEGELRERSPGR